MKNDRSHYSLLLHSFCLCHFLPLLSSVLACLWRQNTLCTYCPKSGRFVNLLLAAHCLNRAYRSWSWRYCSGGCLSFLFCISAGYLLSTLLLNCFDDPYFLACQSMRVSWLHWLLFVRYRFFRVDLLQLSLVSFLHSHFLSGNTEIRDHAFELYDLSICLYLFGLMLFDHVVKLQLMLLLQFLYILYHPLILWDQRNDLLISCHDFCFHHLPFVLDGPKPIFYLFSANNRISQVIAPL